MARLNLTGCFLILAVGCVRADKLTLGSRIEADALVASTAHVYRFDVRGVQKNDIATERTVALVGLTGEISQVVSVRAYFDIGAWEGGSALDVYTNLAWPNGVELRVGQFLLPVGFDLMAEFGERLPISTSLLVAYAKPGWSRDIGAMGRWCRGGVSVSAAVVNGAGGNSADNNEKKDLCARATWRPLTSFDGIVALRGYYGWPDGTDTTWRTVAAEARVRRGPLEIQTEVQNHHGKDARNNAGYLQLAWDGGLLAPLGRFDLVLPQGRRVEWMATVGLNICPIPDRLRLMLDYSYRRNSEEMWSVSGAIVRLQASI